MELLNIRKATVEDIPDLIKLRRLMFGSMGYTDITQLEKADFSVERYFYDSIQNKTFHGWVALTSTEKVVSSVGVVIDQHPPSPSNLTGKIAYIMNLCTLHEYRKQGIARKLMKKAIGWIKKKGLSIVSLHATDMGQKLYEQLGFIKTNEMRLIISS